LTATTKKQISVIPVIFKIDIINVFIGFQMDSRDSY